MSFKLPRCTVRCTNVNPRPENHGPTEKVAAGDLSFVIPGTKRTIDMLFPQQDKDPETGRVVKLSDLLYDANGIFRLPLSNPFSLDRKVEVHMQVWDQQTARAKPMVFEKAKLGKGTVTFLKGHKLELKVTINLGELDTDEYAARLWLLPTLTECDLELEALQEDMFQEDGEEEEDDAPEGEQAEIPGTEAEEEDDEEEDEDEEEDDEEDDE